MKVIRMKNKTEVNVPVVLANGPTVYMYGGSVMENVEVVNWADVSPFVDAVVEMQEVRPKGMTYLKG